MNAPTMNGSTGSTRGRTMAYAREIYRQPFCDRNGELVDVVGCAIKLVHDGQRVDGHALLPLGSADQLDPRFRLSRELRDALEHLDDRKFYEAFNVIDEAMIHASNGEPQIVSG